MKKYHNDYREIMHQAPDIYKIKKYEPASLTDLQILACLKIYIERDKRSDGWIYVHEMVSILKDCLKFRASLQEVEFILKKEYPDDFKENIANEKVNFSTFIQVVDILKREKLVLVQLGNNLNYFIFLLLMVLLIMYVGFFYTIKSL